MIGFVTQQRPFAMEGATPIPIQALPFNSLNSSRPFDAAAGHVKQLIAQHVAHGAQLAFVSEALAQEPRPNLRGRRICCLV